MTATVRWYGRQKRTAAVRNKLQDIARDDNVPAEVRELALQALNQ